MGTFTVLIPIATTILGTEVNALTLITVSATLGGAVFGDHLSPISDTTILSSTGAACNHVNHVKTQMPYAALIAVIAFVAYLLGGGVVVARYSVVRGYNFCFGGRDVSRVPF